MQRLLVLNLFIALLWPVLNNDFTLEALLIGFGFGFVLTSLVQHRYGQYAVRAIGFVAYVLLAILQSNLRLAGTVLASAVGMQASLRPGIVAVPLELTNPFDITVLATVITLTPGTLSVDLGEDVSGRLRPFGEHEDSAFGSESERSVQRVQSAVSPIQLPHGATDPRDSEEAALLVHAIDVAEPEVFRAEIKRQFENPLIELRRLLAEMDSADT